MSTMVIAKKLSANDTGETGGHQAGILIPKRQEILQFFPDLTAAEKNPRKALVFIEPESFDDWTFNFIYYNNAFFGGTRNEYRLTGMTKYFARHDLHENDELIFKLQGNKRYVTYGRQSRDEDQLIDKPEVVRLKLSSGWKVIEI